MQNSPEAAQICHQLFSFPLLSGVHLLRSQLADTQLPTNIYQEQFHFAILIFNSH